MHGYVLVLLFSVKKMFTFFTKQINALPTKNHMLHKLNHMQ